MLRQLWILLVEIVILTIILVQLLINQATVELPKEVPVKKPTKKDWHDYRAMYEDRQREGLGELGMKAQLNGSGSQKRELEEKLQQQYALNALLSDAISVNRSVPDGRDIACLSKKYYVDLPPVSIIIIFHYEYLSTFTRTLHSIVNRTPPELLKEIILVDDFSDVWFFATLEAYARLHFKKVIFIRLPERMGIIRARLAGIRAMTAKVFVILDAHVEVNYNWLPPLLEPIVKNRRTVVCPIIDLINAKTLEYEIRTLRRGGFNWFFTFKEIDYVIKNARNRIKPFYTPVMMGGLFAMSVDFFWELGGYDDQLEVYGGEQYELSFKIWMCGGKLLNAPCSRMAHHFRAGLDKGIHVKEQFYLLKNMKRVAEVWMDEYKSYLYDRFEGFKEGFKYASVDAGDLSVQKKLRKNLNCKSFDWFLKEIAYDFLAKFPPALPVDYAYGAIRALAAPNLCIDLMNWVIPGLYPCSDNLKNPRFNQRFALSERGELRSRFNDLCFDIPHYHKNAPVVFQNCHKNGGNQFWYYDRKNQWLIGRKSDFCLEAVPKTLTLQMNTCRINNLNMKWKFGLINETALDKFLVNFKLI